MRTTRKQTSQQRRWVFFNNGCIHGIHHTELLVVRRRPDQSLVQDSVSIFSISRTFGVLGALMAIALLVLLLTSCLAPRVQKGGGASTSISRPGHTNSVTLFQSDNPKQPSQQTVQSEQTLEYVLPAGTAVSLVDGSWQIEDRQPWSPIPRPAVGEGKTPAARSPLASVPARPTATLDKPMPVRLIAKDRTETSVGGAQKDLVREWSGKAARMQPVMWAGIGMMSLVAGVLIYFGWWTKAGVAAAVGLAMIVLAHTLPDHGTIILFGGITVFSLAALLVLYAYYKGQLDQNANGIPDLLERHPAREQRTN